MRRLVAPLVMAWLLASIACGSGEVGPGSVKVGGDGDGDGDGDMDGGPTGDGDGDGPGMDGGPGGGDGDGDGNPGDSDGDVGDGDGDSGAGDGDGDGFPPELSGLDARPANPSCRALPRPLPQGGTIAREALAPGVSFPNAVTDLKRGPAGLPVWFGISHGGELFSYADGASARKTILDSDHLSGLLVNGEFGLLGLAVDPEYPSAAEPNRVRVFLYYISNQCPGSHSYCSHLRRFDLTMSGAGVDLTFTANPQTNCGTSPDCEQIFTINQPGDNHNGGGMAFGKDGYLYVSFGDGGGAGACNSQNLGSPHGKLFRLDVHAAGVPYAIPASNPFSSETALCNNHASSTYSGTVDNARGKPCPEIVAAGLRNPFRIAVDRETGDVWIGDVGEGSFEELDRFSPSLLAPNAVQNFGWPRFEALTPYDYQNVYCDQITQSLRHNGPYTVPRAYYPHDEPNAASVVGGYVYRGTALGERYQGRAFLADVYTSDLWAVDDPYGRDSVRLPNSNPSPTDRDILHDDFMDLPYGFAEDDHGELVIFGASYPPQRLVLSMGQPGTFPENLVDTGCVDANDPRTPVAGMVPYGVNAELWSDGAEKQRYLAIPDGTSIALAGNCSNAGPLSCAQAGDLELPVGSVLMKVFRKNDVLLETRLLMRHDDGDWAGYTYVWNQEQTAATLVEDGTTIAGQDWQVPSQGQCLDCHTRAAGRSLGLEVAQLNGNLTYPATGRTANQLATLSAIGMLETLPTHSSQLPTLAAPAGDAAAAARAYLHANCSHCHRPGTGLGSDIDLRHGLSFAQTGVCNAAPSRGGWPEGAAVLVPGNTELSLLSLRTHSLTPSERMPPLGTRVVDTQGVARIDAWVSSVSACP